MAKATADCVKKSLLQLAVDTLQARDWLCENTACSIIKSANSPTQL